MPIEVRELVVRVRVDEDYRRHSAHHKSNALSSGEVQELKRELLNLCREEIQEILDRERER